MTIVCKNVSSKDAKKFLEKGFTLVEAKGDYEVLRLQKPGATITLYTSGKMVIQTSADNDSFYKQLALSFGLVVVPLKEKKEMDTDSSRTYSGVIGSDETLKGDTFGGLVVVGAYFTSDEEKSLIELGVKDSKKLTDLEIGRIAEVLLAKYVDHFVIENISVSEYNKIINSHYGITALMNDLHKKVGAELRNRFEKNSGEKLIHFVDKYPGCNAGDVAEIKGEEKSVNVAAASIVARKIGLDQFEALSDKAGFNVPKGSTHVKGALELLMKKGVNLNGFVKVSFKNVIKAKKDFIGSTSCGVNY